MVKIFSGGRRWVHIFLGVEIYLIEGQIVSVCRGLEFFDEGGGFFWKNSDSVQVIDVVSVVI